MKKIKNLFVLLICVLCIFLISPAEKVQASGIVDIEDFNNLTGDAKYLGSDYRDNYYLDIAETGMFDGAFIIINNILNILFGVIKTVTYIMCVIVYYAMEFDITDMLANQIRSIQEALNNSIFMPLFELAVCGASILLIKNLLRRNMVGVMIDVLKVIFVVIMSVFVVKYSSPVLSATNNITKEVCVQSLVSLNEGMGIQASNSSYGAQAAGVLWVNMVHEPWKSWEFWNNPPTNEMIEKLLSDEYSNHKNHDGRQEYIDELELICFRKELAITKMSIVPTYLIPFIIKCGFFIVISLLQLYFQIQAIFWVIIAPIILLLALIPGYDLNIVSMWLHKILESQIAILVVTLMMGLLIRIDQLLYGFKGTWGWYIVVILQTAIAVGIYKSKDKLIHSLSNVQRGLSNARFARSSMVRGGNIYNSVEQMGSRRQSGLRKTASSAEMPVVKEEVKKPSINTVDLKADNTTVTQESKAFATKSAAVKSAAKKSTSGGAEAATASAATGDVVGAVVKIAAAQAKEKYENKKQARQYAKAEAAEEEGVKRPRMDAILAREEDNNFAVEEQYINTKGYDSSREILQSQGLWSTDFDKGEGDYGKPRLAEDIVNEHRDETEHKEREKRSIRTSGGTTKEMNIRNPRITTDNANQSYERANMHMGGGRRKPVIRTEISE